MCSNMCFGLSKWKEWEAHRCGVWGVIGMQVGGVRQVNGGGAALDRAVVRVSTKGAVQPAQSVRRQCGVHKPHGTLQNRAK